MTSSFIICTKDRPSDLQKCVESIARQTILPYELIIVDASSENVSSENKKNCERILGNKIKLIYIRSEPSTTKQRNIGVDNASGDIVFFLDDDVILEQNYHRKMLEVYKLKSDQNIGGVRGSFAIDKSTCIDRILDRTFRKLFLMARYSMNEKSRFLPSLQYVFIEKPTEIIEIECMPACICSYYRKIFNKFKFDEMLDKYAFAEDKDLSYRVSRKYKLYQTPYALLSHNHSPISRLSVRECRKVETINRHYLAKKHLPPRSINWLAYYWSLVGYLLFFTIKNCLTLNYNDLLGTVDGIRSIMMKK